MKITYLKLRNFANIKTAMGVNEIEIDFLKAKNKIILITGPNGGGKTSMLSCLHPFANNGNLDVRNDNPLVIVGKEGYKEIHYIDGTDTYIIKHYYTQNKESHTIKSYIEKNGTELNPNGNQTSFKDIVKEELDIEPDYLKLVRLGNNVTNFIDHKAAERKAFMGKILSEVDIYLKYFKKINKDMIELKSVISHLIDKIYKLSIDDPDELEKTQKKLKAKIEELSNKISGLNGQLSIIQHEFEKYDPPYVIREMLNAVKEKQAKLQRVMDKQRNPVSTIKDCEKLISQIESEIATIEATITANQLRRGELVNRQDKLIDEMSSVMHELEKISSSEQIRDTEAIIQNIKRKIDGILSHYKFLDAKYTYSKKEIEELIVMLDRCNDILYTTYEFGKAPIVKAIEFILNNDNINTYVENRKNSLTKNKLQATCEYVFNTLVGKKIPKPNCKNSSSCEVMQFYDKLYDLATEVPDAIIEDDTFVTYTKMAYQNISTILDNLREKKSLFDRLPKSIQDMFTLGVLFDRMQNMQPLYDKAPLYSILSEITEYELFEETSAELKSQHEKLNLLRSLEGNSDYFEKRKAEISAEIEDIRQALADIIMQISKDKQSVTSKQDELKLLQELQESLSKKESFESEIATLEESYSTLVELAKQKSEVSRELDEVTFEFNKLQTEFNNNDYKLHYYRTYNDELATYNKTYDEMTLVRSALSSKEGIPLLFIQIYLKNVQDVTNELLEIIYGDDLYIDNFVITADEFKIPYNTKGTDIKDVCYASQGERSFISLALSFALIYQAISRYNILLLDEIDATLDTDNRSKFLQVLEKHISMIDGEQVFVISHNNMFNMYPVDVINTRNETSDENRLAHYLYIKKK